VRFPRRRTAVASLAVLVGCGGPAARSPGGWKFPEPDDGRPRVAFAGTVKSIEMLGRRNVAVIPVHFAGFRGTPRLADGAEWAPMERLAFGVTVEIDSAGGDDAYFAAGREVVLAIHSPAQLFHAAQEDVVGKRYDFTVYIGKPYPCLLGYWRQPGGSTRYCGMVARLSDRQGLAAGTEARNGHGGDR
jgi:hypothetical protein